MKCTTKFFRISFLILLSLALNSSAAFAVNAVHHRPTTGAMGGYQVHTTETLAPWEISLGYEFNYSDDWFEVDLLDPLVPNNIDLGDQLASSNFIFAMGIWEGLTFNVDLPLHMWHDINLPGKENQWDVSPGDMQFSLKARLVDARKNDLGLGLALIPFITAPSGDFYHLQGESTVTGGGYAAVEKLWERTRLYANVGARLRRTERIALNDYAKSEFLYGAGLQQNLSKDLRLDFVSEVIGATRFKSEITSPAELDFLLRKTWGEELRVMTHGGAGLGLGDGYGAPDWRLFAGLSLTFGGQGEKQTKGPVVDTDGDGLTDDEEIHKYRTDPKNPDTDGDRLTDGDEVKKYKTDPLDPNTDKDDCKDGEEVLDFFTNPKKKGDCPPYKIELKGKINFEFNRAGIKPESFPVLDQAVEIFKRHQELQLIEIEGHADSKGADAYNLALSNRRADSVRQYFIRKGIQAGRLTSKGYGESQPVATNDTEEGRAKNRRIVFTVKKYDKNHMPRK